MYRITGLFLFLSLSLSTFAGECFTVGKDSFYMTTQGSNKVVICLKGNSKYCGLYFCYKKDENQDEKHCQGDDDSGSFVIQKNIIYLKGDIMLGNPDDAYQMSVPKKVRKKLVSCSPKK